MLASDRAKKQFSNIENRRRCSYRVGIDNGVTFMEFKSCFEAAIELGYSEKYIHSGVIGENIKSGTVRNKKSKYYGWNIYKLPKKGGDIND